MFVVATRKHAVRRHRVGNLFQSEWNELFVFGQILKQIHEAFIIDRLLEPFRHRRLPRCHQLLDIFSQNRVPFSLSIDDFDGGQRFRSQQAADHHTIHCKHGVLPIVGFDTAVRVENMGE